MTLKRTLKTIAVGLTAVLLQFPVMAEPADAGNSNSPRPDGGRSLTTTTRSGSQCTVFSKEGVVQCTRSNATTNHQAAVAKCVAMKC